MLFDVARNADFAKTKKNGFMHILTKLLVKSIPK